MLTELEPLPNRALEPVQSGSATLMQFVGQAMASPDFDPDKLATVMGVMRQFQKDEAETAFNHALAEMQPRLPRIAKNGRVKYGEGAKKVDFAFATYETIHEAISPLLAEYGFALSFDTEVSDKGDVYICTLSHRLGHSKQSHMRLPADTSGGKNSIQAVGSTDSYARRYLTTRILNIVMEGADDDGRASGFIDEDQVEQIRDLVEECGLDNGALGRFLATLEVSKIGEISKARFPVAVNLLNQRKQLKDAKK